MVFGPGSKDHKSINSILPEGLLSNLEYRNDLHRLGKKVLPNRSPSSDSSLVPSVLKVLPPTII